MPDIKVIDRETYIRFYVEWDDEVIPVRYSTESGFDYDEDDLGDIDGVAFADFLTNNVVITTSIEIKE